VKKQLVADVMTRDVMTVDPNDPVDDRLERAVRVEPWSRTFDHCTVRIYGHVEPMRKGRHRTFTLHNRTGPLAVTSHCAMSSDCARFEAANEVQGRCLLQPLCDDLWFGRSSER
jgi:hypothetical protein